MASLQLESWQVDYTPIHRNLIAEAKVFDILASVMINYEAGSPLKAELDADGHCVVPVSMADDDEGDAAAAEDAEDDEGTTAISHNLRGAAAAALEALTPHPDLPALAAIGNECLPIEIQAPALEDVACNVHVRAISEAASAAIFTNVLFVNALPNDPARSWSASRSFSKPAMYGLFSEAAIPAGAFISEYRGELLTADGYRQDPLNQYANMGASKPHVHVFPPPLSLAIDARRFGTASRFARFGCHPNAVIRPILFSRTPTSGRGRRPSS
ncbi:MAG: SET domain-containing protein [Oxalobacteraceae bacterium]|nr:MAG: SET domain-containing protein [Oxalobacteraceae bacterium]